MTTSAELKHGLRSLGISHGDLVMVHASLRAIGPVAGGPMSIAQALLDAVGTAGTLTAYVSWEHSPYEATLGNRLLSPEEELNWPRLQVQSPPYPGFGALNRYLLKLPGVRRSMHPDASIMAVGAKADDIVAPHTPGSGYGPGSPIERIIQFGGKVLLLGAPLDAVTVLHYAEAVACLPAKRSVNYRIPDPHDPTAPWIKVEELDSNGILDVFAGEDTMDAVETIARAYVKKGSHTEGTVGSALCHVFDARDIVEFGIQYLEDRFA